MLKLSYYPLNMSFATLESEQKMCKIQQTYCVLTTSVDFCKSLLGLCEMNRQNMEAVEKEIEKKKIEN